MVSEHENQLREQQKYDGAQAHQRPVAPGHLDRVSLEFPQNRGSEVAVDFSVHRGERLLQSFANLAVVMFGHFR